MRKRLSGLLLCGFLVILLTPIARAGDISGTVSLHSSLHARAVGKIKVKGYGDDSGPGYNTGRHGSSGDDTADPIPRSEEMRYVVLSLTPMGGKLKATPGTYTLRQSHKEFIPHVMVVVKGSQVTFANNDEFLHNIYSVSEAGPFELPKYARGMSKHVTFSRPGIIELFCSIHTRMNAYIYVTDNDYYAMPGADNRFVIKNVPPGTYQLKAWHPRTNSAVRVIQVPASGNVQADLSL